jgi:hypothetical protein
MAAAIVTVVYSIVIGKGLNVLDAPIAGVVPHPVQHFDVLGHKSGLGSVDISPPPDERRNNTQYTHVVASEFFKREKILRSCFILLKKHSIKWRSLSAAGSTALTR